MRTVSKESLNKLKQDIINGEVVDGENSRKSKYGLYGSDYDYVFLQDKKSWLSNIEYLLREGFAP